jgi:tRNA-2-methylthio-N6-dimethylallyladenosine synthase
MANNKKVFIKTYGCQMNVYDSERMSETFGEKGYQQTDKIDNADLILLNTCHIREKASEKMYSELGRLKHLKKENPNLKIGVAGCVAQAEGQEIINRQPLVDLVVGPQAYHRLPELIDKIERNEKALDTEFPLEDKFDHLPKRQLRNRRPTAFLTVQEGCDKFCSFCVVPYTRGVEVSRNPGKILVEAEELVSGGVREITLLGQNVNAYHGQENGKQLRLVNLIEELSKIKNLERIRFTTSHPNDMDDELINAFGKFEKLMPYLHLPVQSGSDRILRLMNRKHTSKSYKNIIARLRVVRPDILLSGDFIVGFPGETESDFQDTLSLVEEIRYGQAYSFKYSARPGTPAAEKECVANDVAVKRLHKLQALLTEQQKETQEAMVGKKIKVLFEKPGRDDGQLIGKSEYLHAVHVTAPTEFLGTIQPVIISDSVTNSLAGKLI